MVGRIAALSAALAASAYGTVAPVVDALTSAKVTVNYNKQFQQFDGMGISEAFQRGRIIEGLGGLSPKQTNLVLDLLFSNTTGAGLTILRNGIGSSPSDPYDHMESIAPVAPKSNSSALNYVSLESLRGDQDQIELTKQFFARGGRLLYGDAWSADGYMKTNNTDTYGGLICGVTNATCATGDWRQAYANKLVKWLEDYKSHGIEYDFVGFLNEPDQTTPYASMNSDGQQAVDFLEIFQPTLAKTGMKTKIACCDGSGWEQNRERIDGINAANGEGYIDLVTAHGYSSYPSTPFNTTHKTWITEWSTFDPFNPSWYVYGGQSEGLTWANNIQSAFANSNISAFLYWWGAANDTDNEPLITIPGDNVNVSSRLWALAHWGRLVQPGAFRTSAIVKNYGGSVLNATSFYNPDGSSAIQVINNGATMQPLTIEGAMNTHTATVTSWTTDSSNNFTENVVTGIRGYMITADLPPYSLTSFYISQTKGSHEVSEEA